MTDKPQEHPTFEEACAKAEFSELIRLAIWMSGLVVSRWRGDAKSGATGIQSALQESAFREHSRDPYRDHNIASNS